MSLPLSCRFVHSTFFFFNDTATTEIYTLSLHDALPISDGRGRPAEHRSAARPAAVQPPGPHLPGDPGAPPRQPGDRRGDRKSTRLNSSHGYISYAVFCLKKKKKYRWHDSPSSS